MDGMARLNDDDVATLVGNVRRSMVAIIAMGDVAMKSDGGKVPPAIMFGLKARLLRRLVDELVSRGTEPDPLAVELLTVIDEESL